MPMMNQQDEAYEGLKTMVLTMQLKPGEKIDKHRLEDKLGIGITPIREAIIRLRREGLFNVIAQSGTYVSKIDLDTLSQGRYARMNIERSVTADAVKIISADDITELERLLQMQSLYLRSGDYDKFFQADEDFHELFYKVTDKEFIWHWLRLLNLQFDRFRYLRLELPGLEWDKILNQHKEIVARIKAQDAAGAADLVVDHLHMVDDDVKIVLAAYPEYFAPQAAAQPEVTQ
ncbi:GntR family transcriptional regulator [Schleiferilactobacillus harbinensis]|jgi:DNA-binding GntR family transcriptional regulator|uniref:GntR family transcriptional regulator n=1 Tax=Schleiferilactobacillus harbinensis TaxID=304207 RepID=UPI0007B7AE9D|nr:GntR family transcriptional regulator [Schleiferilactobacillus harbinensis]MBO3092287.1 GntR family transcriptional regulator [Schleiferilactobacillus harbinensis]